MTDRLDPQLWRGSDDEPDWPSWFSAVRPQQAYAAAQIVDAFNSGSRVVAVQAPPGAGKTALAEMVRRSLGVRAMYTAITRQLQDQQAADFPYSVVLKGRSNFPTLLTRTSRTHAHLTAADCVKSDGACAWCPESMGGVSACPYERRKAAVFRARLSNTNLSYLLAEMNGPGSLSGKFGLIVCDEADALGPALTSFVEASVSRRMMDDLSLDEPARKTVESSWPAWFAPTMEKVKREIDRLSATLPDDPSYASRSDLAAFRRIQTLERLLERLSTVSESIGRGGWVYDDSSGGVTFRPIRPDSFGPGYVWRHAPRWLLMSATLLDEGEVRELQPPEPMRFITVLSTFAVGQRPVRYAPVAVMSNAHKETAWPKMAVGLGALADLYPTDRILVHTVSYVLARYLAEQLGPRAMVYENADARTETLDRWLATSDGILLAPSMARGVDLSDSACRLNVIVKLAYPYLGDRQVKARLYEEGNRAGGQIWYARETIRALVQASGRVVRSESDFGLTVVLDAQFERLMREWGHLVPKWFTAAIEWDSGWRRRLMHAISEQALTGAGAADYGVDPATDVPAAVPHQRQE